MANRKKREPEPISETEVEIEGGALVWVAPNLPTHAAYLCKCSSPSCSYYIWGRSLAVRDKRGVWRSLYCAIREKITTSRVCLGA
jgi:hypothetical protein